MTFDHPACNPFKKVHSLLINLIVTKLSKKKKLSHLHQPDATKEISTNGIFLFHFTEPQHCVPWAHLLCNIEPGAFATLSWKAQIKINLQKKVQSEIKKRCSIKQQNEAEMCRRANKKTSGKLSTPVRHGAPPRMNIDRLSPSVAAAKG